MVKSFEHLSDAQLEQYGAGSDTVTLDDARTIEAHLEDCADCRSRLLEHQRSRFAMLANSSMETSSKIGPSSSIATSSVCTLSNGPSEEDLRNLAAGIIAPDKALAITEHVAQCPHCAPILRAFAEDFSDDLTDDEIKEEKDALAKLKSSSPKWQKKVARQVTKANRSSASADDLGNVSAGTISSASDSEPHRTSGWSLRWVLVPAALAACAAIAFGIWFTQRETPERVEKLLAQAYTEQRTMEMRIPYAAHADFKQTRSGEGTSLLSSPGALRKAADQIAANLKKTPDDPKWLMLQARLDILDWRYQAALSSLNRIDDASMQNAPQLEITKSLALFEKAEIEHDPQQYGEVIELLGKALQRHPDDPVALFNHALACEKMFMYVCSTTDFERLIRTEADPGWRAEAEEHLRRIQEKKKPER